MIKITDNTSKLMIDLVNGDGDAYVSIQVESRGFAGSNDLHVFSEEFTRFCRDLLALQSNLKGEARLRSVSPEELDICFKPFDGLGHISVSGKTGFYVYTDHSMNWHAVEFGFEVDPQQLDEAIKVPWVKKYAQSTETD